MKYAIPAFDGSTEKVMLTSQYLFQFHWYGTRKEDVIMQSLHKECMHQPIIFHISFDVIQLHYQCQLATQYGVGRAVIGAEIVPVDRLV